MFLSNFTFFLHHSDFALTPMVANTNDGTNLAPYLRCDINGGNLFDLPPESSGPKGDERAVLQAVKAAGFQSVQGANIALCRELGLAHSSCESRIME